ncbi:tetratricopeptide repeat protein, partial [bacterium]|nr:tetratricopeptide repeat protein [bacterium]
SVEIVPTDPSAHNNLGNSLQELGRLEDAEASYLKAISLDFVYGEAHNNLGNTFLKGGKLLKARSSYNQAILAAPDLMEAHYNLGNTLSQLGRFIEAEISYTRAIDLDPNFAKAYTNSGNTFTKIGRLEDAEKRYKQAIVLNPAYSEAHVNLGNLLQEIGRSDEAVVSYQNAIKLEPEACTAHYGLGNCFKELGRFKDAELCYRNALAFRPDYPEARNHLLTCLFLLEKKSSFLKEFDRSPNYGIPNAVEGSLMHRAALKFGSKLTNAFCLEPLNYLAHTDLGNKYDFTSIFVDTARAILWDRSVTIRQQPLLLGGFQSFGNIFEIDKDFTEQIQVCIRNEIELYRLSHHTSADGYIKHWPVDYILYGWLINMKSGGQLKPHIHETGWLSGSVYINVPHKSLPDSGSLVVSLAQDHDGSDSAFNQKKIINVETGDLVLFPSSLTHYTLPFESDEDRVVLAFDVIPI